MKRYSQRDNEFWMVADRKFPMPFPGRYPTRWAITAHDEKGVKVFRYVGKPNKEIAYRVIKLARTLTNISVWEFDRGGAFRYGNNVRDYKHANPLIQFYYMLWVPTSILYPWCLGMFPKQMLLGKRKFVAYSAFSKFELAMLDGLRRYKRWLGEIKPWSK